MTLANQTSTVTHNGNGATTVWPYTFIIPDAASARVGLFEIATNVLTELAGTAYSITGLNDANGGEVTYPLIGPAITSAFRLVIWRALNYTQDTDLTNQTPYYPTVLEGQLDRIVMQIQQLSGEADRALKVTQGSALDPDTFIAQLQSGAAVATSQAGIATAQAAAAAASAASIDPGNLVHYTAETKTAAQQGQARANIGAGVLGGFRNKTINGNFSNAQRGTSILITATGQYHLDRWFTISASGAPTVTQSTIGPPMGDTYYLSSTQGSLGFNNVAQVYEAEVVNYLKGKLVTATAYIRRNATFSAGLRVSLAKNATANTAVGGTWSEIAGVTTENGSIPSGTTSSDWLKVQLTATVPNDGTANGLRLTVSETADYPAGASYALGHVSLVEGDATVEADPFSPRHIQQELALCQRYFRTLSGFIAKAVTGGTAADISTDWDTMRVTPTLSANGPLIISDALTADWTQSSASAAGLSIHGPSGGRFRVGNFSGLTAGTIYFHNAAPGAAAVTLDAEL